MIPDELKAETMKWVTTNPIVAGLIAIVGFSIHARITKLVRCVFDFIQNVLVLTDRLELPGETYVCFLYYLHERPDHNTISMTEEDLRIQSQETSWWDRRRMREDNKNKGKTDSRKLVNIPGPGFHFVSIGENFWKAIWLIVYVSNEGFCNDKSSLTIVTFGWNRSTWVKFLQKLLDEKSDEDDLIKIYLPGKTRKDTYSFRFRQSIPRNRLCHPKLPILPHGIKENLLKDAKLFLASEEHYDNMGVHWTRGFAFFGAPGNGKTSISKWLARELGMNLCIIKQKIYQAGSFASLMEHCPENSVIVIEDFDTLFDIEKREDDDDDKEKENVPTKVRKKKTILKDGPTVTLGEILNAIDSPLRTRKTILTFSSNMENEIDPALLRPGRIDKIIRLPNATYEQVTRLFKFHFPSVPKSAGNFAKLAVGRQSLDGQSKNTNKKQLSMAEIRGCLMYPTVTEAFNALRKLVK